MSWELQGDYPIYLQLIEILQQKILTGEYPIGEKLPSVRELATVAAVNPNTMQKALTELERMGLVYTNRTSGRYVTSDETLIKQMRTHIATKEIQQFVTNMIQLGYTKEEVLEELNQYMKERK